MIGVSIRNEDVFIIQSGSQDMNDNIIELCIMIQAARIGSAKRVTAVLPYFPYCKQSKRKGRTCITAKRMSRINRKREKKEKKKKRKPKKTYINYAMKKRTNC